MHSSKRIPFRKSLGFVASLFVLSVVAPFLWRTGAPEVSTARKIRSWRRPVPQQTQPERSPQPARVARRTPDLSAFRVPARVAPVAPPVADRIKLDPSIAETPLVPALEPKPPPVPQAKRAPQGDVMVDETDPPKRRWISDDPPRYRPPSVIRGWPTATALLKQLAKVQEDERYRDWAHQVTALLHDLDEVAPLEAPEALVILGQLEVLAADAAQLATQVTELDRRAVLLRSRYALVRRLKIWQQVAHIAAQQYQVVASPRIERATVLQRLGEVDALMGNSKNCASWHTYLMTESLRKLASTTTPVDAEDRSRLARRVLSRMESPTLSLEQRAFLERPEFARLQDALRHWVCEPINYARLLDDVERYETHPANRGSLAACYQILRWSPSAPVEELADNLNTYYRNANIRVAVSGELLNRLLPVPKTIEQAVDDEVLGTRVIGRSRATTRFRVVLVPDRSRWRFGLEASGELASRTEANHGPARFHNEGRGWFHARKLLLVDRRGVRAMRAQADADTTTSLTALYTDFDSLPILNLLARSIARQQYDLRAPEAEGEFRNRVRGEARTKLDEEAEAQINKVEDDFSKRVYMPLARLNLEPEPVDLQTTQQRLIVRYRLAGLRQLAANTPRPQAPGSSLLSVQVHESSLNNVIEQLKLDGKRTDLRNLYVELGKAFERPDRPLPEDFPEGVTIQFAEEDAVRLRLGQDRLELEIRLAELSQGRHEWNNFVVRARYRMVADGLDARFVRDGHIKLKGRRLNLGDQVSLRGIFSKVLERHPDIELIGQALREHPKLQDQQVVQLVARDGWLGIAIGSTPIDARLGQRPQNDTR